VGSVLQVLRKTARGGAFAVVSTILAACSTPTEHASLPTAQAAEAENALPQPPQQSAEEQRITDHAHQAYVSCLNRAAHYADDHLKSSANVAGVIAPMCYAQFEEYEIAAEVGMSRHDTWLDVRHGDQQQAELAEQAIKQERSQAALSITK
jgi:hypothetical protein